MLREILVRGGNRKQQGPEPFNFGWLTKTKIARHKIEPKSNWDSRMIQFESSLAQNSRSSLKSKSSANGMFLKIFCSLCECRGEITIYLLLKQ
jgi:hypothetical protein